MLVQPKALFSFIAEISPFDSFFVPVKENGNSTRMPIGLESNELSEKLDSVIEKLETLGKHNTFLY